MPASGKELVSQTDPLLLHGDLHTLQNIHFSSVELCFLGEGICRCFEGEKAAPKPNYKDSADHICQQRRQEAIDRLL